MDGLTWVGIRNHVCIAYMGRAKCFSDFGIIRFFAPSKLSWKDCDCLKILKTSAISKERQEYQTS